VRGFQGIGDVSETSHPSLCAERQRRSQRPPLSAAVSEPASVTSSPSSRHQWVVRSNVESCVATPPPWRRQDNERSAGVTTSPRYKTELCRTYAEHGSCRYGDRCQFAHGPDDLRAVARHPKYKTDLCRTYHTTGLCPYGPRCHFIHNDDEAVRHVRRPTAAGEQRHADLCAPELELRLALLSLCQQRLKLCESRSLSSVATSTCSHLDPHSAAATATAPSAVRQWHLALDRRQSVPVVVQSSTWPLMGGLSPPVAGAGASLDSVGNSPSSRSAADDYSPPPLSPTTPDAAVCHLVDTTASNEQLTALLILAAKLRLLQPTAHRH